MAGADRRVGEGDGSHDMGLPVHSLAVVYTIAGGQLIALLTDRIRCAGQHPAWAAFAPLVSMPATYTTASSWVPPAHGRSC